LTWPGPLGRGVLSFLYRTGRPGRWCPPGRDPDENV